MSFMMRVGLRGLGAVGKPVTALLLVGKVQGIVQGASKEGIVFMGLLLHLGMAEGTGGQVVCEVLVAAVRGLHLPTEEEHGLWAGVWP